MFTFKSFDYLTDEEIDLRIEKKLPANDKKGYVPTYKYVITKHGQLNPIGNIDIRIGDNENTFYGGHIGYQVYAPFRGNSFATKACKIIKQVAASHGMKRLIITCNPDNHASRKTCEKAGYMLKEVVDLPASNEMYQKGERTKCRYEYRLPK